MIAGHFGLAAAVKAKAPHAPLWALMLATQWLDVVFAPLLACGIETLEPLCSATPGAYGGLVIHANYTHSLVGALGLSCMFGALAARRYGAHTGYVLGGVVMSHWGLDLLVHRADMPLVFGGSSAPYARGLGLGLWGYPAVSAALECFLVVLGCALYWRAATRLAGLDTGQRQRAHLCGAAVGLTGLLTLGLNVMGL